MHRFNNNFRGLLLRNHIRFFDNFCSLGILMRMFFLWRLMNRCCFGRRIRYKIRNIQFVLLFNLSNRLK